MSSSSNSQKVELDPRYVKNVNINMDRIKNNIDEINSNLRNYRLIGEIIDTIEKFLAWINQFKDNTKEKNIKDYNTRDMLINLLKNQFDNIFKANDLIQDKIKYSKEILDDVNTVIGKSETSNEDENNNLSGNIIFPDLEKENILMNAEKEESLMKFFDENENEKKSTESKNNTNSNNRKKVEPLIQDEKIIKENFINTFEKAIEILKNKARFLIELDDISKYPKIKDFDNMQEIFNFIKQVCDFSPFSINDDNDENFLTVDTNIKKGLNIDSKNKIENSEENEEEGDSESELYVQGIEFNEIKNKLFYFINIISKENDIYSKNDLNNYSTKISELIEIEKTNIFLIQNSQFDNFVKSNNFNDIPLMEIKDNPLFNKFCELKMIKMNLLIKEYKINNIFFDDRGNFLNPNSRRNMFRGKEIYDAPYGWMGLGLNVLGKYKNDDWLEDISNQSEWAIAYRFIAARNINKIKYYLKYFIENRNLNILQTTFKKQINDSRRWKSLKEGIIMTPLIQTAEKYTQSISFNNKKYKVLLMAKVKINEIVEPKGSNFWFLKNKNNKDIRIYRVLFKEII